MQHCLRERERSAEQMCWEGDGVGEGTASPVRAGGRIRRGTAIPLHAVVRLRALQKQRSTIKDWLDDSQPHRNHRGGLLETKGKNNKRSRIMQSCTCTYSKKRGRQRALGVEKGMLAPSGVQEGGCRQGRSPALSVYSVG